MFVICKDASNYSQGNEKQLVMIQKQENTRIYSPVYVDWDKHLIYLMNIRLSITISLLIGMNLNCLHLTILKVGKLVLIRCQQK